MQRLSASLIAAGLASTLECGWAQAGLAVFELGDQDFADRQGPVLVHDLTQLGMNEPFPFNGTIFGSDFGGRLGAFAYSHTFSLGGQQPLSASLTLGLLDHDSFPGDRFGTIALSLNGMAQPVDAFLGASNPAFPSSASVVTINVPIELLKAGRLDVSVAATRAAAGMSGNAIEADFSRLSIFTAPYLESPPPLPLPQISEGQPTVVPLPPAAGPAAMLLGAGVVGKFFGRLRRRPR